MNSADSPSTTLLARLVDETSLELSAQSYDQVNQHFMFRCTEGLYKGKSVYLHQQSVVCLFLVL